MLIGGAPSIQAQPGDTPPGDPAAPPHHPPPAPGDLAVQAYNTAYELLVAGDLGTAAARLDDVAARASDPDLANRARELARLARALIARGVTFTVKGAEASTPDSDDKVDGRTSFIVWSTFFGLYGGIVLSDDANIQDFRAGILTVTATTAAGLFGSYAATRGRTMTGSMADAYSLGMLEGVANAALLVDPVGLGHSSEQIQTTILISGALGGAAGLGYGVTFKPTRGQVAFAGTLSVLGAASTGLGIGVAQPSLDADAWLVAITAGTDLGLAGGLGLGRNLAWSVSRGRIVQLGVLLGGLTGLAAGALINGDQGGSSAGRTFSATTLGGLWAGFAVAVKATGDMQPDRQYAAPQPTTQLVPMPLRGGAGLGMVGSF